MAISVATKSLTRREVLSILAPILRKFSLAESTPYPVEAGVVVKKFPKLKYL